MTTEGIGDWVEREFGAPDERLFELDFEEARMNRLENELAREYERAWLEMEALDEEFVRTIRAGREAEGDERDQYKQKAKKIKRDYESKSDERDKYGLRLTATLVVRSFLDVGDEEPESTGRRIYTKLHDSIIKEEDKNDYLEAVADILDIDRQYIYGVIDDGTYSCPGGFIMEDSSDPVTLEDLTKEEPTDPVLDELENR